MDQRVDTLRALLIEAGLSRTLSTLFYELQAPSNSKPSFGTRDQKAYSGVTAPNDIPKAYFGEMNTTKSLTPDKNDKRSVYSNEGFGINQFSGLKQEMHPKGTGVESWRNISTKSEDFPSKKRHPQKKSNQMMSDMIESNEGKVKNYEVFPRISNISVEKSEKSHEFSFGEESISPYSPVNKSPIHINEESKYGTIRDAQGTPMMNPRPRIEESFIPAKKFGNIMNEEPSFRNWQQSEEAILLSKVNFQDQKDEIRRGNSILSTKDQDKCVERYRVNNWNWRSCYESLLSSRTHLNPKFKEKVYGFIPDEAVLKKVNEATKVLKLDLKFSTFLNAPKDLIRDTYQIISKLKDSTFSEIFLVF